MEYIHSCTVYEQHFLSDASDERRIPPQRSGGRSHCFFDVVSSAFHLLALAEMTSSFVLDDVRAFAFFQLVVL